MPRAAAQEHRDSSNDEKEAMMTYHDNLKKLLSTVEFSVTSEMNRRRSTAQVVAEANKTLPLSVYECE